MTVLTHQICCTPMMLRLWLAFLRNFSVTWTVGILYVPTRVKYCWFLPTLCFLYSKTGLTDFLIPWKVSNQDWDCLWFNWILDGFFVGLFQAWSKTMDLRSSLRRRKESRKHILMLFSTLMKGHSAMTGKRNADAQSWHISAINACVLINTRLCVM